MASNMGKYAGDRIFGIDLGTTFSSIAYVNDLGIPKIVPNREGHHTTPSVIYMDGEQVRVGLAALEGGKTHPERMARYIKRSMGRPDFRFNHNGDGFGVEELSSFILRKLVQDAGARLGCDIRNVVITCPAYFGINERESVRVAGEIAGLNVRQIINEPTAAAIAYGASEMQEPKKIVVYDLGGGTFDITMIDIRPKSIKVIGTGGDPRLGGKDWNDRLVQFVAKSFYEQTGTNPEATDILADHATHTQIHTQCEHAKKALGKATRAEIGFQWQGKPFQVAVTQELFARITADLMNRTLALTSQMLKSARKKGYTRFDEIILVGGSTYLPQVARGINSKFGIAPKLYHPEEAIARGAAIFGWKMFLRDRLVERIANKVHVDMDLGELADNLEKVARKADSKRPSLDDLSEELELTLDAPWDGSEKATRHREAEKVLDEELNDIRIDVPAEAIDESVKEVAQDTGFADAAVKNSMMEIQDVASKSMGYAAKVGKGQESVFVVVGKNTILPVTGEKTFLTGVDGQKGIKLRLVESDEDSEWLDIDLAMEIGRAWALLPPGLPVKTPLKISFYMDKEGQLSMTVLEKCKGRTIDFTIQKTAVVTGEELEQAKARRERIAVE